MSPRCPFSTGDGAGEKGGVVYLAVGKLVARKGASSSVACKEEEEGRKNGFCGTPFHVGICNASSPAVSSLHIPFQSFGISPFPLDTRPFPIGN